MFEIIVTSKFIRFVAIFIYIIDLNFCGNFGTSSKERRLFKCEIYYYSCFQVEIIIVLRVLENGLIIFTGFVCSEMIFYSKNKHEKIPFIVPVESSKIANGGRVKK